MRKRVLTALMVCAVLLLTACGVPDALEAFSPLGGESAAPDLRLLDWPAYDGRPASAARDAAPDVLRVDLWLDASQVMGGVNPNVSSLYPHSSLKYREGGFHYRFGSAVGMYEGVLRCLLSAAEGSRVRVLRAGNERLPDSYLTDLAGQNANGDALRSIRRDMLTYAIDPMPSVFSGMSDEKMENSFYALGTPALNRLRSLDGAALENPALADKMARALDAQISAIQSGEAGAFTAVGDDLDYPLLYALDNLDLSRLSVVTCDPASIRRLSSVTAGGSPVDCVSDLLEGRGVFDQGLCVELYAFTLDYMGQMISFGPADFAEPLIWGRLDYNRKTQAPDGALPMPRTLVMLVVGAPAQVERYTAALNAELELSDALKGLRGPENGQLTYTRNGENVAQQPFAFEAYSTRVTRPQFECYTQHTSGARLSAPGCQVSTDGVLNTVTLAPDDQGAQPDRELTLAFPVFAAPQGLRADLENLVNAQAAVEAALLLSHTAPTTLKADGGQTVALRDTQYVFTRQDAAFQSGRLQSPFALTGASLNGDELSLVITVDGPSLKPGFYRVLISADLSGAQVTWEGVPWVDDLSVSLTNEQISAWEVFSQAVHEHDGGSRNVPRQLQHAWGPPAESGYHGITIPDFPPVMRAPGLSELLSQLRKAANVDLTPCVRYVLDVFVPAAAQEGGVSP